MSDQLEQIAETVLSRSPFSQTIALLSAALPAIQAANAPTTLHPFGFLVTRLGNYDNLGSLRLHIWPAERRPRQNPNWPVHSHPWELHSRILCGIVTNQLYDVQDTDDGEFLPYEVSYSGDTSIMEATNRRTTCVLTSETKYKKGDDYWVDSHKFHNTEVDEDIFAATIVMTNNQTPKPPIDVGRPGYEFRYEFKRQECPPERRNSLFEELARQIK